MPRRSLRRALKSDAFLRDEGEHYDSALARQCIDLVLELFHRRLGEGDRAEAEPAGPAETRH